jgi:hypothetical protein
MARLYTGVAAATIRGMNRLLLMAFMVACAAQRTIPNPDDQRRTPNAGAAITQDELVRRTQSLLDAVTSGDKAPWHRELADDAMYFDEKGRSMDKKALVADLTGLPKGYSGSIKLVQPKSHIEADVAILSYDLDESEEIFGQKLRARYHETDTWLLRNGAWQIAAGQVLRYYEDPAEGRGDSGRYPSYAGTYELAPGSRAIVSVEGGKLFLQRGAQKQELVPEGADIFFRRGIEGRRLFRTAPDGRVDAMIDRRNNEDVVWKKAG